MRFCRNGDRARYDHHHPKKYIGEKSNSLALGVKTADCVPILFADAHNGVIAAAHAGWQGAFSGIITNTVKSMLHMGAQRTTLHAAIGPCIRQTSYEVGGEFFDKFTAHTQENARFFRHSLTAGHFLFDLVAFVRSELVKESIEMIEDVALDTFSDETLFYSHRKHTHTGTQRTGTLLSVICLQ